MKVLIFGREYPPHISGGLGTACYVLIKELVGFVIVPGTAVETMQLGGIAGLTTMTMKLSQDRANVRLRLSNDIF
jgi:hypothetical protein